MASLRADVKRALAAKGEDVLSAEDRAKLLQLQRDLEDLPRRDHLTRRF